MKLSENITYNAIGVSIKGTHRDANDPVQVYMGRSVPGVPESRSAAKRSSTMLVPFFGAAFLSCFRPWMMTS